MNMTIETLKKLRNKESVRFFDKKNGWFVNIQFNKKETKFVCWERWVSKNKQNWVNHNLYLSLKDIDSMIGEFQKNFKERQLVGC